ncbi:hypothetical protein APB30_28120 [Pseudomonas aeruginosa]|nr:hypothetical protein AO984_27810 [Pseudomonas aeruginosa]KSK78064.2 hypothetical protein APA36_04125 [Pseudomonas aeruginosa]KSQ27146.2 hypothetical protein APB30_28120 [Pseudomonas aeruginosa]
MKRSGLTCTGRGRRPIGWTPWSTPPIPFWTRSFRCRTKGGRGVIELKPYQPVGLEDSSYWEQVGVPARGAELYQCVKEGFDYAVLERLAVVSEFPCRTLAMMVGLSAYAVRQARRHGQWSSMQSDRLFRLARVLYAAQDLFGGDWTQVRHWFVTPQRGLGGGRPIDWLLTEVEARMVLDLIGRIGHGVVI